MNPDVSRPVPTTYLIKQLELALRQSIDGSIRRYGLTTPPYMALIVLAGNPGLSSAELARRCFVTPQAANEMVAVLERKGLVQRHVDADNHRILDISLTEIGMQILDLCRSATSELEHRMVAGLGHGESEQFQALLERCLAAIRPPSPAANLRPARRAS